MCGVTGYTGPEIQGLLEAMNESLRHRGPDGEGVAHGALGDTRSVHFGHRRLAVIDLDASIQPMWSADRRWLLSYNGEIYNYRELREELEQSGSRFRTEGDTEVLLESLIQWGDRALERLDGMFAFAACDLQEGRLLLAVDRFGQKPLVWGRSLDGFVCFASEVHALRCVPGMAQDWDQLALIRSLSFNAPPAPQTIFEGIQRLEPGTALAFELDPSGRVRDSKSWRWWTPDFEGADSEGAWAPEDFILDLRTSVERHLVSDVPLGILLSGGVDSSVVAAQAAEHRDIKTLSMGFGAADYDERSLARKTSQALGSEHYEFELDANLALETLDKVVLHLDEPLADASCIPSWHLYAKARELVTVAVGGDGCDELLEGYPTFRALELARAFGLLGRAPGFALIRALVDGLPVREGYYPFTYKLRRFVDGLGAQPLHRLQHFVGGCSPSLLRRLIRPDVQKDLGFGTGSVEFSERLFEPMLPEALVSQHEGLGPENRDIWLHLRTYLAGEVLRKVDRMSMAHGLEVRAPLLGSPFAERCLSAPSAVRRVKGRAKLPLRAWLETSKLSHVASEPKHGFAIPVSRWLRHELKDRAEFVFRAADSPLVEWCRPEPLERLWLRHRDGHYDARKALWSLMVMGLWLANHRLPASKR